MPEVDWEVRSTGGELIAYCEYEDWAIEIAKALEKLADGE